MKSNKKGQGAMAYAITYGWAILVVIILVWVLWEMGIFDINKASEEVIDQCR